MRVILLLLPLGYLLLAVAAIQKKNSPLAALGWICRGLIVTLLFIAVIYWLIVATIQA